MLIYVAALLELTTRATGVPPDASTGLRRALMWALLLIISFIVLVLLAMWFRRQFLGGTRRSALEPIGFSLADLRRLRDQGKITQEEYERTRDRIVHSAHFAIADAAKDDRAPVDAPQTKDVDLIRDAER